MGKYIIVAKCDPYNARCHWNGQKVIKYDGATPIEWVQGEFDTENEAKDALYEWCLKENMDFSEWFAESVADTAYLYCKDGLVKAAEEILHEYNENGDGIYLNTTQIMAVGDWCYSWDVMSYSIETIDYAEE